MTDNYVVLCECGYNDGRHCGPMTVDPDFKPGSQPCCGTTGSIYVTDCDCKDFVEMVDVSEMITELQRMAESLR